MVLFSPTVVLTFSNIKYPVQCNLMQVHLETHWFVEACTCGLIYFPLQADAEKHTLAKYLMELTLVDYDLLHRHPSEIAAAALCLSQNLLDGSKWVILFNLHSNPSGKCNWGQQLLLKCTQPVNPHHLHEKLTRCCTWWNSYWPVLLFSVHGPAVLHWLFGRGFKVHNAAYG